MLLCVKIHKSLRYMENTWHEWREADTYRPSSVPARNLTASNSAAVSWCTLYL